MCIAHTIPGRYQHNHKSLVLYLEEEEVYVQYHYHSCRTVGVALVVLGQFVCSPKRL